jgi:hypothetical protein
MFGLAGADKYVGCPPEDEEVDEFAGGGKVSFCTSLEGVGPK